MPDYQNGKIYKLVCNVTGKIYIGSTTQKYLSYRLTGHVRDYKNGVNITSSEIIKNNNYDIILLETYPCNNSMELRARERYYIENNICVNKLIPSRTKKESQKEYYKENIDKIKEESKIYYQDNKEKIIEYKKEFYKENKDQISDVRKQFYQENKDHILFQKKQYYKDNKDIINERRKEERKLKKLENEIKNLSLI